MSRGCKNCGELLNANRRVFGYCNSNCAFSGGLHSLKTVPTHCERCGKKLDSLGRWCNTCRESLLNPPVSIVTTPKPVRHVAAESEQGESSGRPHNYMGMGGGENANGCWDNLVKDMEDYADEVM